MTQLRPLTVGEMLDAALRVYRTAIVTLMGVAAVTVGVPTLLLLTSFNRAQSPESAVMAGLGLGVLYLLGSLLATAATVAVVADTYLGTGTRLADALRFALGKIGRLFIAGLAKWLIVGGAELGILLIVLAPSYVALRQNPVAAAVVAAALVVAMLAVAIALLAAYSVVTQAVVLEDLFEATDAISRSWQLTRGARGRAVLLWITVAVLIALPLVALTGLGLMIPSTRFVTDVLQTMVQLLLYPIFGCVFTVFYYDLRVRKEAFDLVAMERELDVERGVP